MSNTMANGPTCNLGYQTFNEFAEGDILSYDSSRKSRQVILDVLPLVALETGACEHRFVRCYLEHSPQLQLSA
jgi:hypothetical protein